MLDKAESKIYGISQRNLRKNTQSAEDLVLAAKKKIEEISKHSESQPIESTDEKDVISDDKLG